MAYQNGLSDRSPMPSNVTFSIQDSFYYLPTLEDEMQQRAAILQKPGSHLESHQINFMSMIRLIHSALNP